MNSYDEVRRLIERRYRRRLLLGLHLTAFVVAVVATASWITTHWVYPGDWKNMWYLVGWAILLFLHWGYFRLANRRDNEIETAWMRFGGQTPPEKVKLDDDRWRGLSDDGKSVDWMDETYEVGEKLKRHG